MRPSTSIAPRLGSILTASAGVMDILSALYPALHNRMEILRDLLPIHLIRGSQTATVLVGFLLILLADGLRKRRTRAMQITIVLLLVSSALNLTKGLDFEEAIAAAGLAAGLMVHRGAFTVSSRFPAPQRVVQHLATFGLLYYGYVLLGFFVLRRVIAPAPTLLGLSLEPFRLFMDAPAYRYLTPHALWFERSIVCVGSILALVAFVQVLRPFIPRRRVTPAELARVRRSVRRYGSDTLSYFSLQDGRNYFFDATGEAFLSYRMWGTVALVAGDPVGPDEAIGPLIASFVEYTESQGIEPCFIGASGQRLGHYHSLGLRTLKIGEEAVIDLRTFDTSTLKRKVRRAARHVAELGIRAEIWRRDALPDAVVAQLEAISRDWVEAKGGAERGFSMTLGRLPGPVDTDCELVIAMEGDRVWGYLSLVPVFNGNAWSLDTTRRRSDSPNGMMEFLVIHTAEAYRARGYSALSLNFATLSNSQNDIDSKALDGTRRFLYEHLSSRYQMRSLHQFNSKFQPEWRSRYLAYRDVLKIPKLAIAIAQAEDPIRLPSPAAIFRR